MKPWSMRSLVGALLRSVLAPVRLLVEWLRIRASPSNRLMGFTVVCTDPDEKPDACFGTFEQALSLIGRWDPKRLVRLKRDVSLIAVSATSSSHYEPALRAIYVAPSVVRRRWPEYVAATLVHEAMHARLSRLGLRHYWRNRDRHEALCARAEREFVARLPVNQDLVRAIEHRQRSIDWSRVGEHEARSLVRDRRWPAWAERVVVAVQRLLRPGM